MPLLPSIESVAASESESCLVTATAVDIESDAVNESGTSCDALVTTDSEVFNWSPRSSESKPDIAAESFAVNESDR